MTLLWVLATFSSNCGNMRTSFNVGDILLLVILKNSRTRVSVIKTRKNCKHGLLRFWEAQYSSFANTRHMWAFDPRRDKCHARHFIIHQKWSKFCRSGGVSSAKKRFQFQGNFPLTPWPGSLPLYLAAGYAHARTPLAMKLSCLVVIPSNLKRPSLKSKERKSIYIAPFILRIVSKRSDIDQTVLSANYTMPAFPS